MKDRFDGKSVRTCFTHDNDDVVSSSVNLDALTSKDFSNVSSMGYEADRNEMSMDLGALTSLTGKSPKVRSSS